MSGALTVASRPTTSRDGAIRLPLSGIELRLQPPTGLEDLLLLESPGPLLEVTLHLLQSLARACDDSVPDLAAVPLYDLDVLLLRLRQSLLGDCVETDAACQARGCGARMDISFGIEEYLEHHRPLAAPWRTRRWIAAAAEPGWFQLMRRSDGAERGLFRLPTARDLLETQRRSGTLQQLIARCVPAAALTATELRIVERAMESLAPNLSTDLGGTCPECGTAVLVAYDPRCYCIAELRQRARFVMEDVDLLAERYHWSEREILALPNRRRLAYAELVRQTHGIP